MIRKADNRDAEQIVNIYNYYIKTSTVTFETAILTKEEMKQRITKILEKYPFLVFEKDEQILGYAYANLFRTRVAYEQASESSVYVHPNHFKKGIATQLYKALLIDMKKHDLKTAIGGITLPNEASVVLHEKLGFKKVAHFEKVGYKFEQWLDVGFWQILL